MRRSTGFISAFVSSICVLLASCSTSRPIEVVESAPAGCEFVREMTFTRCGVDDEIAPADVEAFKRKAGRLRANTVECCQIDSQEIVAVTRNKRTGETCTAWRRRFAKAYRCP